MLAVYINLKAILHQHEMYIPVPKNFCQPFMIMSRSSCVSISQIFVAFRLKISLLAWYRTGMWAYSFQLLSTQVRISSRLRCHVFICFPIIYNDGLTWKRFLRYFPFVRPRSVLCFPWSWSVCAVEQTVHWPMIWGATTFMWCHCNVRSEIHVYLQ